MARYNEVHGNSLNNAEIAISGTVIYGGNLTEDIEARRKYGSLNALHIHNNGTSLDVKVELDGLTNKTYLVAAKTALTIEPWEGRKFDTIKVTNLSAAAVIAANELYINYGISKYVGP